MPSLPPLEPPDRRPWYRPSSIVGAFTRGQYEADANVRELVKILIQGGAVGIALVALFLVYVSQTRIADALTANAKANLEMATAWKEHTAFDAMAAMVASGKFRVSVNEPARAAVKVKPRHVPPQDIGGVKAPSVARREEP